MKKTFRNRDVMEKIKVKVTFEWEYEPNPENYPGCETIQDMLKIDKVVLREDVFLLIDDKEFLIEMKIIDGE